MALAVFLFVLFLPLQGAEAFRGTVERERIPVGSSVGVLITAAGCPQP